MHSPGTGFSNPDSVVEMLPVTKGMQVADLGTGIGQYAKAVARRVGDSGRVFGIDVQKNILDRLETEFKEANIDNVRLVWGNVEEQKGTRLRDNSIDLVIIANALFQFDNKQGAIQEVTRITKQGGKIAIIDWKDSFGGIGPRAGHIFPEEAARKLLEDNGFIIDKAIQAGDHHYGLIGTLQ